MLVEVQLVEWDRFLCELVDSGMSVRSPWERTKRRLVSSAHFIMPGHDSPIEVVVRIDTCIHRSTEGMA